ncbi:MAG TPA: ArsR family transcriptional regulator [Gemmataceae bacterium]|nr:ArsR family transcriptional regulator [Gemmataceae bacterium]
MEAFPEEVKRFLDANVETVEQLEILRILAEDPGREWPSGELAREVQAQPPALLTHLAALHGRGLLALETRGTDVICRYGPKTPELEAGLSRLLQVYRERPVTMIKLVYARAKDVLRTFAEAFRIRKEG